MASQFNGIKGDELGSNIAQNALAELLAVAKVQNAHWYSIKEAKEGAYHQDVNLVLILLSICEELLMAMKEKSGLLY